MAAHAVPWFVAALLLLLLRLMSLRLCVLLLWLVAAHAGVGGDGAHARGVQAGEAEDVAVGEGAQAQEVPGHAVGAAFLAAAAVGGGCPREPGGHDPGAILLLMMMGILQAREAEAEAGGGAGRARRGARHLGVARARAADGGAHLRRLLQQRRGRQVRRGRGQLRLRRRWRGRGRALRCGQHQRVVVGHRRRPRRHLRLHGVVAVLLRRRLHDLLVLVVVVMILEKSDVHLLLLLHDVRGGRWREEQRVVVEVRWRRRGGHGVEADGLGALLGERVAEGAVRDEAVPPAHCIALHCMRRTKKRIKSAAAGAGIRAQLHQKQKGKAQEGIHPV